MLQNKQAAHCVLIVTTTQLLWEQDWNHQNLLASGSELYFICPLKKDFSFYAWIYFPCNLQVITAEKIIHMDPVHVYIASIFI